MLDQMRQKGASIFIYLIFGLLIVLFVINIAPSGGRSEGGCRGSSHVVVDVDGNRASENAYKMAYSSPFNEYAGRGKVYHALDTLIRRELLAAAAEEHGIRVSREVVDEEVKKGYFFTGGERKQLGQYIFDIHEDGDQTWNLRKFKNLVQSLDVSQNAYLEEQVRGLQATLMAELLASSAQVSRDEALKDYLFEHNTVSYDIVTYSPAAYRTAMLLTDADVARFAAAHDDQIQARYKANPSEFVDRKLELKLRQIFIAKPETEAKPEDQKTDDQKPDDKKAGDAKAGDAKAADAKKTDDKDKKDKKDAKAAEPPKPAGMPIAEAKAKLEAAREAVASGKQKLAELAKQLNTDPVLKANGGDVGWKTAENASLGEKVVSDAVKELKPGEMTPVITTDRGAYLIIAEDKRQGKLTYEQVKLELAAELARDVWSKEAAKRDALKALEEARAGKKQLADMFEREFKPGMDLQQLQRQLSDPNTPPEIKQLIEQKLQEQIDQQLKDQKRGAIVIESPDVYASWKAGDGGSAGAPAPAGGGSAAPAPTPAPAPQAAPAPLAPSNDVLPAFQGVVKPKVRKEAGQKRQKRLPGLEADGVKALFDELGKDDLGSRVYEADGNYSLIQVVDKAQGTIDDFDKDAARLIDAMREERGQQLVRDWVKARCEELTTAGKIKPRGDKIAEFDDKGKPAPTVYRPCMTLR